MESYLVEEMIAVTKDAESRAFWAKAVRVLGEGPASEELGELKYQMHKGEVREPAKYLTALLKKQMEKREAEAGPQAAQPEQAAPKKLDTYFEGSQIVLWSSLRPQNACGEAEETAMELPYGKDIIPWTTFISSSFFTLSTNKAKSDVVRAKFRTMDGDVTVVPLTRGRVKPGGQEWGIPTAEHGRVLAAIESIWTQQGCKYYRFPTGAVVCYCLVSIRELARLLGRRAYGGKDLVELMDKVHALKALPYYLDLSALGLKDYTGYGFTLLGKVEFVERMKRGQVATVLKVEFSTPLSTQLVNRRAVSRAKELPQIQSELGFLLRLYIEPILLGMKTAVFSKSLKDLIADLALPPAGWHGHKGLRRRNFEKAIKSMKAQKTADGRPIVLRIEKGLFDWMLTARLGRAAEAPAAHGAGGR